MGDASPGMPFDALVRRAAGHEPYAYQRRVAEEGLPELLRVPTGAGKTLAVTLGWLYRRRCHPDAAVRQGTPRWLAYVLPVRVLVEQTAKEARKWLEHLGLAGEVGLHVVMGGAGRDHDGWRRHPERDAIIVGTLDMLLSRALNRGYGEGRFLWPVDFGLLHAGVQWVFDEVQLMGPALETSRQLEGLRRKLGTALPCASTWMSATVPAGRLRTVDLPETGSTVELGEEDRAGPLRQRLEAAKTVQEVPAQDARRYVPAVARALQAAHRPGTLTLAVMNTVERARQLYDALAGQAAAEVVLLHARFRPEDRKRQADLALARVDPDGPGRIVVATQVVEAGVDASARALFTEAAPWPSIVQRAGRCNRDGQAEGAVLLWARPPAPEPYAREEVEQAAAELAALEGQAVTPLGLGDRAVPARDEVYPVLRRRDLLGLFDTAPDLGGNDLDVARFLRQADDLDVQVAWWDLPAGGPEEDRKPPTWQELCPVPIGEVRRALRAGRQAWRFDHIEERWVRCTADHLRPGLTVVLAARDGGYRPDVGWDPAVTAPVTPAIAADGALPDEGTAEEGTAEEGTGDDPLTATGTWVPLHEHLADAEREARALLTALAPDGLAPAHVEAAVAAARLHDLGKAHPAFQAALRDAAAREGSAPPGGFDAQLWAKSGTKQRLRHKQRPHFRHELAGALALLGEGAVALAGVADPDLAVYLVAAHHGRVRVRIRSLPEDRERTAGRVLGIEPDDELPAVEVPGGPVPAARLDLSVIALGGGGDGRPSWTERALTLRDRPDLGPFRLAFLEAVVRLADWRVSAAAETRKEA